MAGQERGFSSYAKLKKTHRQELYDFPVIKYSRNMTEEDEAKEYARCGVSGRWEIIRADDGNCICRGRESDYRQLVEKHRSEMRKFLRNDDHLYDAIVTEMVNLHFQEIALVAFTHREQHVFVHSHDEYAVLDAIGKRKIDLARSKRLRVAWDEAVETVTGNSVKDND